MRSFKLFIIAFALFTLNVSATTLDPVKPSSALRAEIVDMLGPNCPYESNKSECTAEVLFTVNSNSEIVIISILSSNKRAEGYVKSKLNYKKVSHTPTKEGEIFLLPLRMVKES